jgi:hypothetical protein
MVQCKLVYGTGIGHQTLTCWLPDSKLLKIGKYVSLKGDDNPDRRWLLVKIGKPQIADAIERDWNNNI